MNQQINQMVQAMTNIMVLGMTFGMASPIMLQSVGQGKPKAGKNRLKLQRHSTYSARAVIERHPSWVMGNIDLVAMATTEDNAVRNELLLKTRCVKCGKEMGEHRFSLGKYVCP